MLCPDCPRLIFTPSDPRISVRESCCSETPRRVDDRVIIVGGASMGKTERMLHTVGSVVDLENTMITSLDTPERDRPLQNRAARRRAEARRRNPKT